MGHARIMNESHQEPPLFPPTPRQLWILLLTIPMLVLASGLPNSRILVILISPWVLGMMVMIFDRAGPVRNWFGSVLHSVFYPLALITFNWCVVDQWKRYDWLPHPVLLVSINLLLLACLGFCFRYLRPRRCPSCLHRGMIPLMPWLFREERSNSTHWCALCGSQYWKKEGAWEPERRKTWWDFAIPLAPHLATPHAVTKRA